MTSYRILQCHSIFCSVPFNNQIGVRLLALTSSAAPPGNHIYVHSIIHHLSFSSKLHSARIMQALFMKRVGKATEKGSRMRIAVRRKEWIENHMVIENIVPNEYK